MKRTKKAKPKKKSICKSNISNTIKKRAKKTEERIKEKKRLFLERHPHNACNVSTTCKDLNISRFTFYNWRKADKSFDKKCNEVEEIMIDRAESRLMECIDDHNIAAIIFFLCNKGKKRGWQHVQKIEHSTDPENPPTIIVKADMSGYPDSKEEATDKK